MGRARKKLGHWWWAFDLTTAAKGCLLNLNFAIALKEMEQEIRSGSRSIGVIPLLWGRKGFSFRQKKGRV